MHRKCSMFHLNILRFSLEEPHETIKKISSGKQPHQLLEFRCSRAAEKSMEFYRVRLKVHDFCIPCADLLHAYKQMRACLRCATHRGIKATVCVFHEFISADSSLPDNDRQPRERQLRNSRRCHGVPFQLSARSAFNCLSFASFRNIFTFFYTYALIYKYFNILIYKYFNI